MKQFGLRCHGEVDYRNNTLCQSTLLFGNSRILIFPKMFEHFEFADKVAQTGYTHIVDAMFTSKMKRFFVVPGLCHEEGL